MNTKEKKIIQQAENMPYTEWYKVEWLKEKVNSEDAKRELHVISNRKHHKEEASNKNI